MGKIKGWRRLKASTNNYTSWVANEGNHDEVILVFSRQEARIKAVKKIKGLSQAQVLFDRKFKNSDYAYDSAIRYMRSHPRG